MKSCYLHDLKDTSFQSYSHLTKSMLLFMYRHSYGHFVLHYFPLISRNWFSLCFYSVLDRLASKHPKVFKYSRLSKYSKFYANVIRHYWIYFNIYTSIYWILVRVFSSIMKMMKFYHANVNNINSNRYKPLYS